jgi:uncharacterized protein DUF6938
MDEPGRQTATNLARYAERVRAWVVSADMGFGHQRAAHGLSHLAQGGVLVAGSPEVTDPAEVRFWRRLTGTYEFLSRTKSIPVVGPALFVLLDSLLTIPPFYPLRDLSHPSPGNHIVDRLIRQGLGRTLIERVRTVELPLISSFYVPCLAADLLLENPVYCVICDADLNRVWVASRPKESRIRYFAPCGRVMRRLREYGVPDERIFITGFPLPRENVGGPGMETLKRDMIARMGRLDPRGRFGSVYGATLSALLGASPEPSGGREPVTVTFAVGGAGAQVEIGLALAKALKPAILDGRFRLILIAGVSPVVERAFQEGIAHDGLNGALGQGVRVVRENDIGTYFDRFNALMRETDILWTKPSELSFYSALGIPIVMAPSIGPQESKNALWLLDKGCALPQVEPSLALEWLTDMLKDGVFAEKAFNGFVKNRKLGVYKIEEVLATGTMARETHPLRR